MTAYSSKCGECQQHCDWIPSLLGGFWQHAEYSPFCRGPVVDWRPPERLDDHGDWVTA